MKKTDPFDVQQLWTELQKCHIGMATLYRTLVLLEEDLDTVSERFGFVILERNIVLKGICQDCREANPSHSASHLE